MTRGMTQWRLWMRQCAAILRLELKKNFFSRRAWWIYLLAFAPVLLTGGHSLDSMRKGRWGCSIGEDVMIYAGIFQFFYLRLGIYFGCVGIFTNLFRGDLLEKTLHYYLLAPVRREVLLASKYVAGLLASVVMFTTSAALAFLLVGYHFGSAWQDFLFRGPGLGYLGWYALTAALACVGYGAVFLILGMIFNNPMIPAAVVMVWEAMNWLLPSALKKVSVIFYLKSLCPTEVPVDEGPWALLAVVTEPTPAWLAVPGLLVVAALILVWAALRARKLEITYSE